MRHRLHQFAALLVALGIAACASSQQSGGVAQQAGQAPEGARVPVNRNVITREQMIERNFQNAYDAVEALRSTWLATRGPDSFSTPSQVWVYLDNVKLGDVTTLRTVATASIARIEHMSGTEATARFGVGHAAGTINVYTSTATQP